MLLLSYNSSPVEWLKISMDRKVVTKILMPALSKSHVFRTFKITPRHVNAHAYVNAAFLVRKSPLSFHESLSQVINIKPNGLLFSKNKPPAIHKKRFVKCYYSKMKNSCHAPLTSNTVAQMQKLQKHFSAATKYIGTVYAIIAISTKTLSV